MSIKDRVLPFGCSRVNHIHPIAVVLENWYRRSRDLKHIDATIPIQPHFIAPAPAPLRPAQSG